MFGTHCFDAVMSNECYKQNVKPTALKTVKMLLSNKKIDTFLAKFWLLCVKTMMVIERVMNKWRVFWLLCVKTVRIMCHCSEYPLKSAAFTIGT